MRAFVVLWLSVLAAPGRAAAAPPASGFAAGAITDPVTCAKAPSQTYALYLPSSYQPQGPWPILYAFDPRQRGRSVAERYQAAAEELGWIIASSNNSRSDEAVDPNVEAMKAMWEDTHARFAIDPQRAYATGMSGGARAAVILAVAQRGAVAGVVGHGGGFPFEWPPAKDLPFAFYGLAGWHDFNYAELLGLDQKLANLGLDHHFEPFDGAHQWAPPAESRDALAWMEVVAMRRGIAPRREAFVAAELERLSARARAAAAAGDPVLALRGWESIARAFEGLADTAPARAEAAALRASPAWQAESKAQEAAEAEHARAVDAARERLPELLAEAASGMRPERAAAILDVPQLQRTASEHVSIYARRAAQRTLERIAVQAGFYLPRDFLAKRDYPRALLCLGIAVRIKPRDPWSWVALARGRATAGDERGAVDALRTAVGLGSVEARHLQDDEAFARLQQRKDFRELLAGLEKPAPS
jgi:predicted esterase